VKRCTIAFNSVINWCFFYYYRKWWRKRRRRKYLFDSKTWQLWQFKSL